MVICKVEKRNGSIQAFDASKIAQAIKKAIIAVWWTDFSHIPDLVVETLVVLRGLGKSIPDVETIQDCVEQVLIKAGHDQVAKAYITYRLQRSQAREERKVVVEVGTTMLEYLERTDRRVHANANSGYSLWGMILNTSGKVTANYWLSHIYPKQIGELHRNADLHIHDLDMFAGYCAGRSLRQLLEEWFNGIPSRLDSLPPKNLQAAVNQMINFLGTLQNERAGAQAFSSFDTYLAPFVDKYTQSMREEIVQHGITFPDIETQEKYLHDKTYSYLVQQMQNFIFGLNVPSRWWTQTPFTNITLDLVCPDDLKDKALMLWGINAWYYPKKFGQLQEAMDMINRALLEVYTRGDAKGSVFTFPIPTYNITEEFDRDSPLVDEIFAMTAKYGIPYFQNFVWSQYKTVRHSDGTIEKAPNPDAYKPGAVRSMCCRLQLDLTELVKRGNGLFGSAEMTWSIGVVTINMARIGYLYKGDKEWFIQRVLYLMEQAKISLEMKRKELTKRLDAWLFPYTKRYLHSYRNHFATIWLNWMNEAILNFTDEKENISTPWGTKFSLDVLDEMRATLKRFQEETWNMYNLEATPAEGTTYRFAKEDQQHLLDIIHAGSEQAPYYTNSTQLPVGYTDDCFEALIQQNELQCKYTWGTVLHLYLGEQVSDSTACKQLVKKVLENFQLPYITVTPTFSICPKHGYLTGEHDRCPRCDEEIGYVGETKNIQARQPFLA